MDLTPYRVVASVVAGLAWDVEALVGWRHLMAGVAMVDSAEVIPYMEVDVADSADVVDSVAEGAVDTHL